MRISTRFPTINVIVALSTFFTSLLVQAESFDWIELPLLERFENSQQMSAGLSDVYARSQYDLLIIAKTLVFGNSCASYKLEGTSKGTDIAGTSASGSLGGVSGSSTVAGTVVQNRTMGTSSSTAIGGTSSVTAISGLSQSTDISGTSDGSVTIGTSDQTLVHGVFSNSKMSLKRG